MKIKFSLSKNMVQLLAKEESLDEEIALKKLAYYPKGKLSLLKTTELLNVSVHEVLKPAKQQGLEIGSTTTESRKKRYR